MLCGRSIREVGHKLQYASHVLTRTFQTALKLAHHRAHMTQPVQAVASEYFQFGIDNLIDPSQRYLAVATD
jgi:hypothetical protein